MSLVIDVDAHFEPGHDWLDPFPDLAARLPRIDPRKLAVDAIVGDLLAYVPPEERPSLDELEPPGLKLLFEQEKTGEAERRADFEGKSQRQVADAAARVKWMDEQGIDLQHVICLAGVEFLLELGHTDLAREAVQTCNTWLAETCAEAGGRLLPVTALDYADLDWAVAELERMRALGSRIFLVPAYPVAGVPPVHPTWDRVWGAAVSLGMAPMLHTGFERMRFDPAWANLGCDTTTMRMICSAHRHVAPTTLLNAMIYSGVFERFPNLTLMLAEVGTGWLPFMMREIDDRVTPVSELFLGKSSLKLKPSEYLARNVRATPLGMGNDQPVLENMQALPEGMLLFSSDFPHFEGFTDPMGHYREVFRDSDPATVERFLGGSAQAIFERMGDPLSAP